MTKVSAEQLYAAKVSSDIDTIVAIYRALIYGSVVICWIAAFFLPPLIIPLIPFTVVIVALTEVSLVGLRWMKAMVDQGLAIQRTILEQQKSFEQQLAYYREWADWQSKTSKDIRSKMEEHKKLTEEQCRYLSEMASSG